MLTSILKRWKWIVIGLILLSITALLFTISRPQQASDTPQLQALRFQPEIRDLTSSVEIKGKSSYVDEQLVYAPYSGEIDSWHITEGSEAVRDQLLFVMNDDDIEQQIKRLQATIERQQLELQQLELRSKLEKEAPHTLEYSEHAALERYSNLENYKVQIELLQVELELNQLELESLMADQTKAEYHAPVDGIFLFKEEEQPLRVQSEEPIGKIVDVAKLEMKSTVSEYEVFKIKEGMPVEVDVDAMKDVVIEGKVTQVSKFASEEDGSTAARFDIVISLESTDSIVAGLNLSGHIVTDRVPQALVLPTIAIQKEDDQYYVMVEESDGTIHKQFIEIGLETPEFTEIKKGLTQEDTVILQ